MKEHTLWLGWLLSRPSPASERLPTKRSSKPSTVPIPELTALCVMRLPAFHDPIFCSRLNFFPAMLPMSKIRRTLLPLLWMLGATVTSFSQSNPPPDDYDEDDYPPYDEPCCGQNCESEGTCQLAPCPA